MDKCVVLKALADPVRAAITKAICCEALSVTEIVERFALSQPAISHHLRVLKEAGVVTAEKRGSTIYYSLNKETVAAACCHVREELKIKEE